MGMGQSIGEYSEEVSPKPRRSQACGSRQGAESRRSGSTADTPPGAVRAGSSPAACARRPDATLSPARGACRRDCQYSRQMAHLARDRQSWRAAAGAGPAFHLLGGGMRRGVRLERRAVSDRIPSLRNSPYGQVRKLSLNLLERNFSLETVEMRCVLSSLCLAEEYPGRRVLMRQHLRRRATYPAFCP